MSELTLIVALVVPSSPNRSDEWRLTTKVSDLFDITAAVTKMGVDLANRVAAAGITALAEPPKETAP